jgi:plasmid stabilization system protein ParE
LTYSLHQLEVFESEVRRAVDYYAVEAPEMLDAFMTELDSTIKRIRQFPAVPRIVRGMTRGMHVHANFPYSVLYVVHEHLELIDLTVFLHDRQDQHGILPRFF